MKITITPKEMAQLYTNMTIKDISILLNASVGAVYNYMVANGIPRRVKDKTIHNHIFTDDERLRLSKAHRGKKLSDEQKRAISESNKLKTEIGHKKKRTDGYISVFYPSHPYASKDGFILEHRLVAEKSLGRYLTENESVHHLNHIRDDNRAENLVVLTKSEHARLHMDERIENNRRLKNG